jgi:hypothetical protein
MVEMPEEEEDDGFENCEDCGYIHHYEDKCPNETTCEHYERWKEEEDNDELDLIIIKGGAPEPIPIVKIQPPIVEEEISEYMSDLVECSVCLKQTKRIDLHWNEGGGSFTDVCEPCSKLDIVEYNGKKMKKCLTPCKTYPMMGRSWYKCLGYGSPCSCAYEANLKLEVPTVLPLLPLDIVRNILTYRGSDVFEALNCELTTTKKHTYKWLQEILDKIVDAWQNDTITNKEYHILGKIYGKYDRKKRGPPEKFKPLPYHPDV